MYKFPENETNSTELEENVIQLLNEKSGVNISSNHIESVFRMGKKTENSTKTRPVLISFLSLKIRNLFIQKTKKFVEAGFGLAEDFPKEVSEKRKMLLPVVKALKKENLRVVLKREKLLVEGEEWSLERVEEEMKKRERQEYTTEVDNRPLQTHEQLASIIQEVETPVIPKVTTNEASESSKRIRTSDDEDSQAEAPKKTKAKTTIIGSCVNKNFASTRHPIKEALKSRINTEMKKPTPKT